MTTVKQGLSVLATKGSIGKHLRKVMLLIGVVLLLSGVISEAMYITTSRVAYGDTVVSSAYLTLGILLILVGFLFTLSSVKIPKIRVP